jgi:hypothetical protein
MEKGSKGAKEMSRDNSSKTVLAKFETGRNYILESIERAFICANIILFQLERSGNLEEMSCNFLNQGPKLVPSWLRFIQIIL